MLSVNLCKYVMEKQAHISLKMISLLFMYLWQCVCLYEYEHVFRYPWGLRGGIRFPGGATDCGEPNHPLSVLGTKLLCSTRKASHLFSPGTHLFKTSFSDPLPWTEIHQSRIKDYGGLHCLPTSSVLNRAMSQPLSSVCKVLHKHSQSIHTGPHFPPSYHPQEPGLPSTFHRYSRSVLPLCFLWCCPSHLSLSPSLLQFTLGP